MAAPQERASAVTTRSGPEISISGYIDSSTVVAVRRELTSADGASIATLEIESAAADAAPVMELGRLVRGRGLIIRIRRVCTSFCATLLVPATEHLVVPEGSFLVHAPVLSMERQIGVEGGKQEAIQDLIARQDAYLHELGVDPDRAYAAGEAALTLKAMLGAAGRSDQPLIVPDAAYLHDCLGISSVEMRKYTATDSRDLAHVSKATPLAFLIGDSFYYEGARIATFQQRC